MNYLCDMITKVKNWYRRRSFYVIADPTDNSITFSKALFKHMDVMGLDKAKVYVFRIQDHYAFTVNPHFDEPTQLADIQYNAQYKTIGIESLVPTVNRIFYDYGLCHDVPCKLSVQLRSIKGVTCYVMCRPQLNQ